MGRGLNIFSIDCFAFTVWCLRWHVDSLLYRGFAVCIVFRWS